MTILNVGVIIEFVNVLKLFDFNNFLCETFFFGLYSEHDNHLIDRI